MEAVRGGGLPQRWSPRLDDVRLDEQLPGLVEQVTLLEEGRTSVAFDCTGLLD